ncbi:MAG: TfoX/Sxy family protein [Dehalococcoidia bacterium]
MAVDEDLIDRARALIEARTAITERRQFGGAAFMVGGNVACGVLPRGLLVRCDPAEAPTHLEAPGVIPFEMCGRVSPGWLLVGPEAIATDEALAHWVEVGVAFASSLPAKG